MTQFLSIFGYVAVILRALTLSCQSLAAGGILFCLVCLRGNPEAALAGCRKLLQWSAVGLAVAQVAFISADAVILHSTAEVPFGEIATAGFFLAGVASAVAAAACVIFARSLKPGAWVLLIPACVMLASSVMTSHAAARVEYQWTAVGLTLLHQSASAAWIGGLPFLLVTLARSNEVAGAEDVGRRFSRVAQWSVAGILLSGVGLSRLYVGSWPGLYGTSYGIMVLGKAFLFAVLVAMGALNFSLVRELMRRPVPLLARLKRFSEAEIGIGFTVILAAASLTSQPPAIDLPHGRLTGAEIAERFRPRTPRLESPRLDQISPATLPSDDPNQLNSFVPGVINQPNKPEDIAWSEYNHNWSGIVVLLMGVVAIASRVFGFGWARHWPLAFIGLAIFLFFRADADTWPLGERGFWSSLADPEVLQHRLFAVMIVAFAVFEWGVQVGRIQSKAAALVFPGVCIAGGALLLTHSHAIGNVKDESLTELSHLPIAIFAVLAGWSRWLELRLDGAWKRLPSMVWPVCFVAIGLMLLFYREA